jgi:hypothetical protein
MRNAHPFLSSPMLSESQVFEAPAVSRPAPRGASWLRRIRSDPTWPALALPYALALAVLILDVSLPSWVAVPVLYVVPVAYLAWLTQRPPMTGGFPLPLTCTVLTVAAWPLAAPQVWTALPNRLMAITVVWIVTVLWPQQQEDGGEVTVLQGLLSMCRYCKKIHNDHGSWQALESYVSAHSHASFSHGICPDCTRQRFPAGYDGDRPSSAT